MKEAFEKLKSALKKTWENILNPPAFIKVLTFISAVIFIGGAMAILIIGYDGNIALEILAYTLFGLSALSLAYSVYFNAKWIPSL